MLSTVCKQHTAGIEEIRAKQGFDVKVPSKCSVPEVEVHDEKNTQQDGDVAGECVVEEQVEALGVATVGVTVLDPWGSEKTHGIRERF